MRVKLRDSPLAVDPLRPLTLRRGSAPTRAAHVSAASGLVVCGSELFVVADDELHLGCFSLDSARPGRLLRLLGGQLPDSPARRKQRKPDFEVLLRLPGMTGMPHGALLALGSGSRPQRRAGVLLPLDARGRPTRSPRRVDAAPLLAGLAREFSEVNIEGGWAWGDRLCLLQRGSGGSPNAIVGWPLAPLLQALAQEKLLPDLPPLFLREMPLGDVDGVGVGFTDGVALPDGGWLFCAVAEDTRNAYDDGRLVGAFVGMAGPRHGLRWLRRIAPDYKVEGIAVDVRPRASRALLVTDADDPAAPAWLLAVRLP